MTGTRYDMLGVAPLRMLDHVRDMCARHNVPVSLCGEMGVNRCRLWLCLAWVLGNFQCLRGYWAGQTHVALSPYPTP